MLGVSRPSVREALRVLERMGVIVAGVGSGSEAGSVLTGCASEALTRLLRIHLALANFSMDDIVSTRVMLEAEAVRGAAKNTTTADIDRLRGILDRMDPSDPALEPTLFNACDTDFHVAIADISGNPLLAELMQSLRDAVEQQMIAAFARLEDWRTVAEGLHEQHRSMLLAIEAGDGDGAATMVREHIDGFYCSVGVVT